MKDKVTFILKTIVIFLVFIVSLLFYSRYLATKGLVVKEYGVYIKDLNKDYNGLKIVQFSDVHIGSTVFSAELKNLVKRINDQNPDIIVFTGDLVEQNVNLTEADIEEIVLIFKELKPKIEILTVKGNHDYENEYYDTIVQKLDWIKLNNTYEYVYYNSKTPLVFIGIDDLLKGNPNYANAFSYLNEKKEKLTTIVLMHEPDTLNEFKDYKFNLVLAGHSHLGQVRIPFYGAIFTPIGAKSYYDEKYDFENYQMYINGGIGTSTVKMRLFNRPSINLYRLYSET